MGAKWVQNVMRGHGRLVAVIRLYDLAEMSMLKADELAKPELRDESTLYERDARFLAALLGRP